MHKSSYERMKYLLDYYKPYWKKNSITNVLDIGSYDQNGTYKDLFIDNSISYLGLDMVSGPNVDIVPNDIYSWKEIPDNSYELIITGQVFEHVEYPWLTIKEIERILKPGGFLFLTVPNAGVEHKAPTDCYRFFSDGLIALAKWANLKVIHTSIAGIPEKKIKNEWISEWNDTFLVAQKGHCATIELDDPFRYEMRWLQDGKIHLTYKNMDVAIQDILETVKNNRDFILFGAGKIGKLIESKYLKGRVYCFVDNSKDKIGKRINGKAIIGFNELLEIAHNYNILISAQDIISIDIKKQLLNENIDSFTLYLE